MNRKINWSTLARQLVLRSLLFMLACFVLTQVSTVVFAQDVQPATANTVQKEAMTAISGSAGGQTSPLLTGERHPLYRLHKSDVVEIKFAFEPEFDQVVNVQPDGFIGLKGLDELYAERLTLPELREALRAAYSPVLRNPEINVFLRDFDRPYFIASGEVSRPGKYDLRADITATEAIAIAGGFTEKSRHSQVLLFHRITPEIVECHLLNVKSMLKSRNLEEDVRLMPGDLLFVPQNTISKIKRFLPTSDMSLYSTPTKF